MKNWQDIVWQLLFGLIIVFLGGWIVGSVVNFAAMVSPRIESKVFCPTGSSITSPDHPNQSGPRLSCYDENGAEIPPLADADSIALQRKYFYLPSNIFMIILVSGWFIWQRKKNRVNV